ncbi:MAG: serine/threonine-protein phosphatase [Clostridia bacterium]|nr:serine/threonine-protein phosphatase [Clostridia bacterium]
MENKKIEMSKETTVVIPAAKETTVRQRKGTKKGHSEPKSKKNYITVNLYPDSAFTIPGRKVEIVAKQILGTRKNQQDSFSATEGSFSSIMEKKRTWSIVCDGMGGLASGEVASQTAVEVVKQVLASALPTDSIPDVLMQAIRIANAEVNKISEAEDATAGTTLVCVVIDGDEMHYASVGDSRIYLCRGAEIVQLNRDHNYMLELTEMVQKGEITMEMALSDPQKEALISFIGIEKLELVDISTTPIKLQNNDMILLCSDGLTKVFNDNEIFAFLRSTGGNVENAVDTLLMEVQSGRVNSLDNTTIALMKYNEN